MMQHLFARFAVLALFASTAGSAMAADGALQRALSQAACTGARLERLAEMGLISVYRANCTYSSHRQLIVTCTKDSCRASPERALADE